jgi:Family of unknown function (DUF6325)
VIGPVQVLVVGFDQPRFSGEVLTELTRLREAGIVRLIDVIVVSRTGDSIFEIVEAPEGLPADLGGLAAEVLGQPADAGIEATKIAEQPAGSKIEDAPTWSLADAVPVGGTAAVALIEHTWAVPLSAAIQRAGGIMLDETWLAPEDRELLETLTAQPQS